MAEEVLKSLEDIETRQRGLNRTKVLNLAE